MAFDPFNPPPPDEAEELARLSRALRLTDRFALFLVTCNRADMRERLIHELRAENPDLNLVTVEVSRDQPNLLAYLSTLPNVREADAVFVYGLESFLPNPEAVEHSPFVVNLNGTRDAFPNQLSCPLVLWLADYTHTGLMRGAPDFHSIRSAGFAFATPTLPQRDRERAMQSAAYNSTRWMMPDEREQHTAQLREMLTQLQSLPDAEQDSLQQAAMADRLAGLYTVSGRYSDAEPLLRNALEARQKFLGEEHDRTAASLNNLALVLNKGGKFSEAESLYRRALEIDRETLGEDHPSIATSLNNLATTLDRQGRHIEAETLLKEALEMRVKMFGREHFETTDSLNNLALILHSQDRYVEAERLFREALEIRGRTLGKEPAAFLNNLAVLLENQGRFEEAEPLYRRALEIDQKTLGFDHPETVETLNNLANMLRDQGRSTEAEALC